MSAEYIHKRVPQTAAMSGVLRADSVPAPTNASDWLLTIFSGFQRDPARRFRRAKLSVKEGSAAAMSELSESTVVDETSADLDIGISIGTNDAAVGDLKEQHKELIRLTWDYLAQEVDQFSVRIFQMIFEQAPEARTYFNYTKRGTKLYKSQEFKFHALRFAQAIDSMVANLENPEALQPLFENLGKLHYRLQQTRGFQPYIWGVFIECTLFAIRKSLVKELSESDLDLTMVAWRVVLRLLTDKINESFYEAEDNAQGNLEASSSQNGTTNSDTAVGRRRTDYKKVQAVKSEELNSGGDTAATTASVIGDGAK